MKKHIIDIVVVTFNRLEKLKKTLSCYENQTASFRNLIVVNNCSTDGTSDYLCNWEKIECCKFSKHVITTNENLGGSGGFYYGQDYAIKLNPDWIFLADDDAYPALDLLENFYQILETFKTNDISSICASVLNADGTICLPHRSRVSIKFGVKFELVHSVSEDYLKDQFDLDVFSYVGPFINCKILKQVGLVNKDLFIYEDDGDHSLRLKKAGRIVCFPSLRIVHDSGEFSEKSKEIVASWRDYYRIRNYMYMLMVHYKKCVPYRMLLNLREYLQVNDKDARKMIKTALLDAFKGNLGKHTLYKPGWSVNNKS